MTPRPSKPPVVHTPRVCLCRYCHEQFHNHCPRADVCPAIPCQRAKREDKTERDREYQRRRNATK